MTERLDHHLVGPTYAEYADYAEAADAVAALVERIPENAWDGPGLGDWDLRALVGHASRSLVTVIEYFDRPVAEEALFSPAEYLAMSQAAVASGGDAIVARGRQAGEALGAAPAVRFRELAGEAADKARTTDPDTVITTIGGGMRARHYLPTRTFELVVHGLDIASATGLSVDVPKRPQHVAAMLAVEAAVATGKGPELLRALTGRGLLSPGFSVT